jgi:hypothetical protein
MRAKLNLFYVSACVAALALGLGIAFWRASAENNDLVRINLTAGIALEAAQDEAKLLRDRLHLVMKAGEFAEAAQTVAETSERAAREKLAQETRLRQSLETARDAAEVQLTVAGLKLAQERQARKTAEDARKAIETALKTAIINLAAEHEAREAAEFTKKEAEGTLAAIMAKLHDQSAAKNAIRAGLPAIESGREKALEETFPTEQKKAEQSLAQPARASVEVETVVDGSSAVGSGLGVPEARKAEPAKRIARRSLRKANMKRHGKARHLTGSRRRLALGGPGQERRGKRAVLWAWSFSR